MNTDNAHATRETKPLAKADALIRVAPVVGTIARWEGRSMLKGTDLAITQSGLTSPRTGWRWAAQRVELVVVGWR